MTSPALAAVEKELGCRVAGLEKLSEADLQKLQAQLRSARDQQEQALQKAFEGTLSHLPFVLRGPVRKLFERG